MKPSKSPENVEVTPSKKKLKQARLPFKLISEVSPTPITPQTRKRKLSAADAETASKIGKLSKENDAEHTVIISDDETAIPDKAPEQQKSLNPFVKLVNTAWKKKLQKNKKGKKAKKSVDSVNGSADTVCNENENKDLIVVVDNEVEAMDVDMPVQENEGKISSSDVSSVQSGTGKKSPAAKKTTPKRKSARKSKSSPKRNEKLLNKNIVSNDDEVLVVENSEISVPSEQKEDSTQLVVHDENDKSLNKNTSVHEANESAILTEKSVQNKVTQNEISSNENEEDNPQSKDEESSEINKKSPNSPVNEGSDKKPEIEEEKGPSITPKRSSRNKTKMDDKEKSLNKSSAKLDDSVCSAPSTPKQNRSMSVTNSLDESLNESTSANLTPKQLQKKLEAAKKKEERDKEKLEREKKKQQEKEERTKQRLEKEEQRKKEKEEKEEAKRKEKEEKEEQRRKEKEEKERQKELEKKMREEKEEQKRKEKEEKEEQRRKEKEAKEEERRKKQEALELEKQEQELKKKKAAEAFVNFFVPKQKLEKDQAPTGPISKSSVLSSFAIKSDMRLAPTIRINLTEEKKETLDGLLKKQNTNESALYLNSLKEGTVKPLCDGKTWPLSDKDDDVMIVEDELPPIDGAGEEITCEPSVREKLRPKLLSFHKNRRPPYWGTWRKKSADVTPRRPFGQDKKYLDYEVDSDEEWEEEPEGESVDGSAAGSDAEEDADEYEVDNELFVPHGYLSDEEATMDDDDVMSLSPETQKARLKHLEDEFESEMKKPTEKLKPRLYGLLWETKEGAKPEKCVDALWNYFSKMAMIMNDPSSIMQPSNEPEEAEKKKVKKKKAVNDGEKPSPKSDKKKKPKPENKETKPKIEQKKNTPEVKKNQPGINSFLTKLKSA